MVIFPDLGLPTHFLYSDCNHSLFLDANREQYLCFPLMDSFR